MIRVVLLLGVCATSNAQFTFASTQWNVFTSSNYYANMKMVTEPSKYFSTRYMTKGRTLGRAKLDCAFTCIGEKSCLAINFYEEESSYVCELLPDNFCVNKLKKTLMRKNGSSVWDKTGAGANTSCFETKFGPNLGTISCQTLQAGCSGPWPNCTSCAKSCIDCSNLNLSPCTIWPDAIDSHLSKPVFVDCYLTSTYITYRSVNLITGNIEYNYQLSFEDMNRLYKLNIYSVLTFWFGIRGSYFYYTSYRYSYMDSEGTLFNMTFINHTSSAAFYKPAGDIFKLNGQVLGSIPFSRVVNDIYGCGSFWVLDANNATFCPGGNVRMWGTPKLDGGSVISSGISIPAAPAGQVIQDALIELGNILR